MSSHERSPPVWYEPRDATPPIYQCPCCDYVTLPERSKYLICAVCFWEDDGQDLDAMDDVSGPNHGMTLRQGRANFLRLGACEASMIKHVVSPSDRGQYELIQRQTE